MVLFRRLTGSSRASARLCAALIRITPSAIKNTKKDTHTTIITVTAWPNRERKEECY